MEKHYYYSFIKRWLEPEKNKKLIAELILLLYHISSNTKTTQKLVFPEFLLNQILYIKSGRLVDNIAFGRETLQHFVMNYSNFLLFYSTLKNQRLKKWDDHEVVPAQN